MGGSQPLQKGQVSQQGGKWHSQTEQRKLQCYFFPQSSLYSFSVSIHSLVKGLVCTAHPCSRSHAPRARAGTAVAHQGQSMPCRLAQRPERGWDSCCWKRGAQSPLTDFARFIPAARAAPSLLINPGLQSRAPSHQGRRNKGRGNEGARETQDNSVSPST